jgi:hypothetical protein
MIVNFGQIMEQFSCTEDTGYRKTLYIYQAQSQLQFSWTVIFILIIHSMGCTTSILCCATSSMGCATCSMGWTTSSMGCATRSRGCATGSMSCAATRESLFSLSLASPIYNWAWHRSAPACSHKPVGAVFHGDWVSNKQTKKHRDHSLKVVSWTWSWNGGPF